MKRKGKYYLLAAFAALAVTVCVGGYSAWQYFGGGFRTLRIYAETA